MLSDSAGDQLHGGDVSDAVSSGSSDRQNDQSSNTKSDIQDNDSRNVLQNTLNTLEKPSLKNNVSELPLDIQDKLRKLEEENQRLLKENESLKQNSCNSEIRDSTVHGEIRNILKPLFSDTQINAIIKKNKKTKVWTDEDISSALTLRSLSPRCYKYLRTKKGFPLPSVSTLNQRVQNFDCEPGLLSSVLALLKSKSEMLGNLEKISVLSLDEMSIEKQWSYDKGKDILYKPHTNVQVVMLRGLIGKWKQPIFYQFDESHMQDHLLDIIKEVEHAGYPVVALVHDLGSTNFRIWHKFGVDPVKTKKTSFKNPCADRDVFVFADVPHLIKLIRNNLVDSGFFLQDGNFVSDASIREIIVKTKTEYGLAYKLNEMHLNVRGNQRQRVKYAVQLLSQSCSKAIKYLGEKGLLESKNWFETAELISLVDEWFDVMNSFSMYGDKSSRNAFGVDLDNQTSVLNKMIDLMANMRLKNPQAKTLYKFQKGVLLSSQSLIGLFQMLHKTYGVKYIMTQRLNQDCLEHFFGCIRQMSGPFEHPNAVDFKFRLRKVLLGKEVSLVSDKVNSRSKDDDCDCISSQSSLRKNQDMNVMANERKLAVEICVTSFIFKNMDVELESDNSIVDDDIDRNIRGIDVTENGTKSVATVIEEESLRYIGGYIVNKFALKYPYLGKKASSQASSNQTWIDMVNRGNLYIPSDHFYSQLTIMREVFKSLHSEGLTEGSQCLKTLTSDLESANVDIPKEVIAFFAKISLFFRMRHLNKLLLEKKKKKGECRSEARKTKKFI